MTIFHTTTRLTLAVLSISLGATVALAADKKPSKPAKPNAPAAVQKTNAPAIKSPRDVASGQATGRTQQPLPPKSILNTQVTSYNFMPPRQAMPNGQTKPSNLGGLDARSPTPQLAYIIDPGMAKAASKSPTSTGDQPELQLRNFPKVGSPAKRQYSRKGISIDKSMPLKQRGQGNRK